MLIPRDAALPLLSLGAVAPPLPPPPMTPPASTPLSLTPPPPDPRFSLSLTIFNFVLLVFFFGVFFFRPPDL